MANKRLHYGITAVGMATIGSTSYTATHGIQSCGITTTFNLEQVFELGQLAIYANIENIPDVEVTLEKCLDGYPLLYTLATQGAAGASLAGRQNQKTSLAMSIYSDLQDSSSGTPLTQVTMSGLAVSSVGYTFPVNGNFSEQLTLVGNDKVWRSSSFTFAGGYNNTDAPIGVGGVNRRQDMLFVPTTTGGNIDVNSQLNDINCTILPRNIPGISPSGTNNTDSDGRYLAKIQDVKVQCNLGRDELFEMGKKAPYDRFVQFPTEVTCDIEITSLSGDMVNATEAGLDGFGNNSLDQTIKIATREGTRLNLGTKNRLRSVNHNGGDANGGNVTHTYSYRTFNDLTVTHTADPTVALRAAFYYSTQT